jgi:WD40 repeat protein
MREHLTYRVTRRFPTPVNSHPTVLAINPEGTFIAVGCASGDVLIWCLNTCDLVCQGSSPGCACGECTANVTSMMWLEGGMLFFGRCNGLVGVMRIGKVRQKL